MATKNGSGWDEKWSSVRVYPCLLEQEPPAQARELPPPVAVHLPPPARALHESPLFGAQRKHFLWDELGGFSDSNGSG